MKYKKLTLALLLVLPFFVTACTIQDLPLIGRFFGSGVSTAPMTLTFWGVWENPDVINALITKYKTLHPNITINYEDRSVLKPDDYKDRIFARANQDLGADIIRIHSSWVPRLRDALYPMPEKLMDAQTFSSSFYPVAAETGLFDGRIYAMPAYYDGLVLAYNKDHFDQLGQTSAPTAWEEFRRLALQLTVKGGTQGKDIIRAGAAMGTSTNIEHFSDILGLMWSQAGVKYPTELDSKAAQDALTYYTNFVKEDGVWDDTMPEANAAFAQNKVSMIFVPSWRLVDLLSANPNLNIGVAPVPQALPQSPISYASYWSDIVPKSSKNGNAAWEFVNFMAQEEQQQMQFTEASKFRPFGAAYPRVSMASQLATNSYLKPLVDTAAFAKTNELAARSGNKKQVDALNMAVVDILNKVTAKDALTKAKDTIIK